METFNCNDAIIIDNGSSMCKAGFPIGDAPKVHLPSLIGRPFNQNLKSCKEWYVGEDAVRYKNKLILKCPIERGVVTDWDDMEKLWDYLFYDRLKVQPQEHPVLLTEPPLNPKKNREKMAEIMFEKYNVPGLYVSIQAVLAFYASGKLSGIALDCGDGVSHIVPVYLGYTIKNAIDRANFAGYDITAYLRKLLLENENYFENSIENEIVLRDIKENLCYIASNYEDELQIASKSNELERKYKLPDGQFISLNHEQFQSPEILFKPRLIDSNLNGIHERLYASIMECDIDARKDLYANIILSGGTTMLPGLNYRLTNELVSLAKTKIKPSVSTNYDRKHLTWIGGCILASLNSYKKMWITKHEYDNYGFNIIHQKCF